MKIKVKVVTDDDAGIGREFYTPSVSYWVAITVYAKLIELLTGSEPDE